MPRYSGGFAGYKDGISLALISIFLGRLGRGAPLPGLDRDVAQSLVDAAHDNTCPYSKATRGNIDVTITLI